MINIQKLPKSRKFLLKADDIVNGYEYVNSKGQTKQAVFLKSPTSTPEQLITFSYPANMITPLKLEKNSETKLLPVDDNEEAYQVIQISFKERVGEKSEFHFTTKIGDEFVEVSTLNQEQMFKLLDDYQFDVVRPWILETLEKEGEPENA